MKLRNFLFIMFFEIKAVIFKFFDEFFDEFFVFFFPVTPRRDLRALMLDSGCFHLSLPTLSTVF